MENQIDTDNTFYLYRKILMEEIGFFPVTKQQLQAHLDKFKNITQNQDILNLLSETIRDHNRLAIAQKTKEIVTKIIGKLDKILKKKGNQHESFKQFQAAINECICDFTTFQFPKDGIKPKSMSKTEQTNHFVDKMLDASFKILKDISDYYQEDIENQNELKKVVVEQLTKITRVNQQSFIAFEKQQKSVILSNIKQKQSKIAPQPKPSIWMNFFGQQKENKQNKSKSFDQQMIDLYDAMQQNQRSPDTSSYNISSLMIFDLESLLESFSSNQLKQFKSTIQKCITDLSPQYHPATIQQLSELIMRVNSISGDSNLGIKLPANLKVVWVVVLYKAIENNYYPEKRNLFLTICNQSMKREIPNCLDIAREVESFFSTSDSFLNFLRGLPVTKKQQAIKPFKQVQRPEILLKPSFKHFEFQRLSTATNKRVITLLFSGFLSEESCKAEQWSSFIQLMPNAEIYTVRWESISVRKFLTFLSSLLSDIAKQYLKGGFQRYLNVAASIFKAYQQNPFLVAKKNAQETGENIAELLMNSQKGQLFNLVGFSLGTEVVLSIIKTLQRFNKLQLLNYIYLKGGAADKQEYEDILKKSSHRIHLNNMHSSNDLVLKYLLKIFMPNIMPIGLNPIDQKQKKHKIMNVDGSGIINGHSQYRQNLSTVIKLMDIEDSI